MIYSPVHPVLYLPNIPVPRQIPKVTWISGLVNPQSFLTAICQVSILLTPEQWADVFGVRKASLLSHIVRVCVRVCDHLISFRVKHTSQGRGNFGRNVMVTMDALSFYRASPNAHRYCATFCVSTLIRECSPQNIPCVRDLAIDCETSRGEIIASQSDGSTMSALFQENAYNSV